MKIETDLPDSVLNVLAKALGFNINFDRSPHVDQWLLSGGHGKTYVSYTGTRRDICAFLTGYSAMRLQTVQILNDLDQAQRQLDRDMRSRLEGLP